MKILKYGSIAAVALLAATIGFVSCAKGGKLIAINVTPADPTIATGTDLQFDAVAIFSNGTAIDWTTAAVWSSSDGASVTMGNALGTFGLATSLVTGTTTTGTFTITATDTANHISGTATLTVVDPLSITITPNAPFMAKNTTHQFTATATLADLASGSTTTITQNLTSSPTLSWSVSDNTIATISSTGLISTLNTSGTTTIMAFDIYSSSTPTATTTLTVTDQPIDSITFTPVTPIISMPTTTLQFTAQGTFLGGALTPDLTLSVTWNSSNPAVATISNTEPTIGLASALFSGPTGTNSTTITATDPITGHSFNTTLSVVTP
jgi:hypothetical protein